MSATVDTPDEKPTDPLELVDWWRRERARVTAGLESAIADAYEANTSASLRSIADEADMSEAGVRKLLLRNGVRLRPRGGSRPRASVVVSDGPVTTPGGRTLIESDFVALADEAERDDLSDKRQFWRAPSGRVHSLRGCTAAAPQKRMRAVMLTREQLDALPSGGRPDAERCRCATWPGA